MKVQLIAMILIFALNFTHAFSAESENVAKVIVMRGTVKAKLTDGTMVDMKVDQSIPEGAIIQTSEKSFVKLLFIDKSQMNLGPNSQMVINAFPKKEAGIITLVKGQIRSQVTKDYMEMDDKSKSKLYIKTKTAAMGIRGTDFQVNYNNENKNTVLITFEGKVAMSNIDSAFTKEKLDQNNLEHIVSNEKSVLVTQGQISAVNMNISERAMSPTKLGTKQIEALEKNSTGIIETSSAGSNSTDDHEKQFRNPIPPGVDGTVFSNSSGEVEKQLTKLDTTAKSFLPKEEVANIDNKISKAEGFFDAKSGEYKLPAGSIVDLNTLNVIPPPSNAIFDTNSKTYLVPESLGKIDKISGNYVAPSGLKLENNGSFTVVDKEAYQKAQANIPTNTSAQGTKDENGSRAPAGQEPSKIDVPLPPPTIFEGNPDFKIFQDIYSSTLTSAPPPPPKEDLLKLATDTQLKTQQAISDTLNTGTTKSTTKVKIILDAQ